MSASNARRRPELVADRYEAEDCPETAAEIRAAIAENKPVLVWVSITGLRGRFQGEACPVPDGTEPRDFWETVQKEFPDVYDYPAVYYGTLGPCAL